MLIRSLNFTSGPFTSPFVLADAPKDFVGNWISIFIGENGSGKSLLLRLLAEVGLGKSNLKSKTHSPVIPVGSVERPSKVIAISGTPLDRFPRGGMPGFARKTPNFYDKSRYVYLGQRAPNGVVGAGQSERILGALLLRHARQLSDRSAGLDAAFRHLGLTQEIGVRLVRPAFLNEQRLRNHPFSEAALNEEIDRLVAAIPEVPYSAYPFEEATPDLPVFLQWIKEPIGRKLLVKALRTLDEREAAFTLSPEIHQPGVLPRVTDWRCALALGLVEISGLLFQSEVNENENIRGEDLSSGQWNWLTSLAGVALEATDDALILIDEPENSLHPEWQRDFIRSLKAALAGYQGCHVVVATHSPMIASGIQNSEGNVFVIRSAREDAQGQELAISCSRSDTTFGWNAADVYEHYFGLLSTRAPAFIARADHALDLVRADLEGNRLELEQLAPALASDAEHLPAHDPMKAVLESIVREVQEPNPEGNSNNA